MRKSCGTDGSHWLWWQDTSGRHWRQEYLSVIAVGEPMQVSKDDYEEMWQDEG
jgi:hypothetical protein